MQLIKYLDQILQFILQKIFLFIDFIQIFMLFPLFLKFLFIFASLPTMKANPIFCSAYCSPNQCGIDQTFSGCTSCDNPMVYNSAASPSCQITAGSNTIIVGSESDGNLVLSPAQSSQTCGSGVQFSGWIDSANQISLSFVGSSISHYKITVVYWIVLAGNVLGNQNITTTLDTVSQIRTFTPDTQGNWCTDNTDTQYYFKISASFMHNLTTGVTLNIEIQSPNSGVYYGIKQYFLLYLQCDKKCTKCSVSSNNCFSCTISGTDESFLLGNSCVNSGSCGTNKFPNSVNHICQDCNNSCSGCQGNADNCTNCIAGLYFMNNVCYMNCGIGYFEAVNGYCTVCQSKCIDCDKSSTNCSACQIAGTYQSYLKGTDCVLATACGNQFYPNSANHICESCDSTCFTCQVQATNCTSCTGSLYLDGSSCVANCPTGLYEFVTTNTCKACNSKCLSCEINLNNCSSCVQTGPNQSFLLGNQCVSNSSCGTGNYPNIVNHVCQVCNISCTTCEGNTDNCTGCKSNLYLLDNICYATCPDGYYEKNIGNICDKCYYKCTICDQIYTNCSACQTSGVNQSFLLVNSCVSNTSCGVGKFANSVTHLCQTCNTSCLTCQSTKDNCTSCSGALSLYINDCVAACPSSFYSSSNICVACNSYCLTCSNSTYCSSCQTSGTFESFLNNNSCVTTCPSKTYKQVSTHTCEDCDISCKLCSGNPSPCSSCNSSYFFFNNTCLDSCPIGYYQLLGNATSQSTCQICDTKCTECFGPSNTQCTACNDDNFRLSNTTCSENCLAGYGQTNVFTICVKCNNRCLTCYNLWNNCSGCYTSGPNKGYYLTAQKSCHGNCPNGYYNNQTTITCQSCFTNCSKCSILPTNCTACISTLYLLNNFCWDNCPSNYYENITINLCQPCSAKCLQCENFAWNCSVCNGSYPAFYLNNRCYKNCPDGYYNNITSGYQCQVCNDSCLLCSGFPSPCYKCAQKFYLFQEVCYQQCPDQDYFEDNTTNQCLLCDLYCVDLNITMQFGKFEQIIYVDLNFSQQIDFQSFNYQNFQFFSFSDGITIDKFAITFEITSNSGYRITLSPVKYVFLYNVTVKVTTISYNGTRDYSILHRPFKYTNYAKYSSLSWFLIKGPDMTDQQKNVVQYFKSKSQSITQITSMPYVQQLNKLGIVALLFPGIQITSSTLLVHGVIPKNMYQGVRLMSLFVFYDVPQWQKQSNHTQYIFSKPINSIIDKKQARMLAATSQWRLLRTGSTTYFILDTYLQLMSIVIAWIILLGFFFYYRKRDPFSAQLSMAYSIFHRIHQLCIMYVTMAVILEWTFFESDNILRWISLSFCIVAIIYFLVYQLKIYFDLHHYPLIKVGTAAYKAICTKYGYFLSKIRFQEYPKDDWFFKLWFRPYNYHVLSFYKKILMMAALPLFHDNPFWQISTLCLLQILEIIRFLITWPFASKRWNFFRLGMEFLLLSIFVLIMALNIITTKLMSNDETVIQNSTKLFYGLGWLTLSMVILYNLIWMIVMFVSFVTLCRQTYKKQVEQIRKQYYFQKIAQYQQNNLDIQKSIVQKWIKNGNLNQEQANNQQNIKIKIEHANIKNLKNFFEVRIRKAQDIQIKPQDDYILEPEKRILIKNLFTKNFEVGIQTHPQIFKQLESIYLENQIPRAANVKVSIYYTVNLENYQDGGKVKILPEKKFLRVSYHEKNNLKEKQQIGSPCKMKRIQFKQCKYGFPYSIQLLKTL